MNELEHIANLLAPAYLRSSGAPLLVCLFTGRGLPSGCEPMSRVPTPPIGAHLNEAFAEHYANAIAFNPEVHDGALMATRPDSKAVYRIGGWSYRLFPPAVHASEYPNRGSAFHSSLAMSCQAGIDAVILFARGELLIFCRGELAIARVVGKTSP
jgi:hypothetical protein